MDMNQEIVRLLGVLSGRWKDLEGQEPARFLAPLTERERAALCSLLTRLAAGSRAYGDAAPVQEQPQRGTYRPSARATGPMARGPLKPPRFRGETQAEPSLAIAPSDQGQYERLPTGGVRCLECQVRCTITWGGDSGPTGFRCPLGQKLAAGLDPQ